MKTTIFSLAALSLMGILVFGAGIAISDSDRRYYQEDDDDDRWERMMRRSTGVAVKSSPTYKEECGSCHMAYPPGLLPSSSWRRIMGGLADHFGDNAELDEQMTQQISNFLISNAADKSRYRRSRQMTAAIHPSTGLAPMRISENPYFKHEHDEISVRVIKQSGATSLSHCNACHQRAEQGSFNEHEIWIKGLGRWDD
ncbi:MAG: diheme cytochrome c [Gammaproteobacteria bacterium]|nr:diheme cytochrome c [Gammaproteobacteria bacterium]